MSKALLLFILSLSACCEYKHDAKMQLDLYERCLRVDQSIMVDYCQRIAEEGARVGACQ